MFVLGPPCVWVKPGSLSAPAEQRRSGGVAAWVDVDVGGGSLSLAPRKLLGSPSLTTAFVPPGLHDKAIPNIARPPPGPARSHSLIPARSYKVDKGQPEPACAGENETESRGPFPRTPARWRQWPLCSLPASEIPHSRGRGLEGRALGPGSQFAQWGQTRPHNTLWGPLCIRAAALLPCAVASSA